MRQILARLADALAPPAERCLAPFGLDWLVPFARTPGRIAEVLRYAGAGAAGLAVDTTVFMVLVSWLATAPALAGAVGYGSGMLVAFVVSVRYVFAAALTGKTQRRLLAEFCASGIFGMGLTTGLIALATGVFAAPPLLAKAIAVAVTFAMVYLIRSAGVFAARVPAETA